MKSKQLLAEINNKIVFLYHRQGDGIVDHFSHLEELKILKDKYLEVVEEEKADDAFVTGKHYSIYGSGGGLYGKYIAARSDTDSFVFINLEFGARFVDSVSKSDFKKSNPIFKQYSFTEIS
jgi:hypothetical protein